MACAHFGVAATTKDCDVLCTPGKSEEFRALVAVTELLRLAPFTDTQRVKRVLHAERIFWSELDEIRVRIFQTHLRPYVSAVRRESGGRRDLSVAESHAIRLACAEEHLPQRPQREYGIERMTAEARANVGVQVGEDVLEWLPVANGNFFGL